MLLREFNHTFPRETPLTSEVIFTVGIVCPTFFIFFKIMISRRGLNVIVEAGQGCSFNFKGRIIKGNPKQRLKIKVGDLTMPKFKL